MLLHLDIVSFIDNAVVLNLAKYHTVNARERRLLAYLSQFKLHINYIPGARNKVADYLSRLPGDFSDAESRSLQPTSQETADDFVLAIMTMKGEESVQNGQKEREEETKWTAYRIDYT